MSRAVFIILILLIVVFSGIVVMFCNSESGLAESIASNVYNKNAENLGNYALQWGIKQITDGTIKQDTKKTFTNFNILNGKIKKIDYDFDWNDQSGLTKIVTDVEWTEGGKTYSHQSTAMIQMTTKTECTAIKHACMSKAGMQINNKPVITGTTQDSVNFSFQDIFGITEEEMKAKATHTHKDPSENFSPVDGITWVEGNANFTNPSKK